ncbi:MAG: ribose-phosphate pyrophosphokinase [Anaerolineae bacterium]|nr:ribose-phosphate pyrophosphokinase [Anaerolineae bacterium]
MQPGSLVLLSGNANRPLADAIARHLHIHLCEATVGTFSDGEIRVQIHDNVRGADVFVIQSTSAPVNHHLMELLIIIDALRRASVQRITAVIPYFGYARQEKKTAGREPISAKLVANLMTTAGAVRVLTIDLTARAIEGFFDIPVDHLRAGPLLADHLRRQLPAARTAIVAPDEGAVDRASRFQERFGTQSKFAIILKHRPSPDVSEVRGMIGDVKGRACILVDDIVSTGSTLIQAADILMEQGATEVYAAATHAVLSQGAAERIQDSVITNLIVTDTIAIPAEKHFPKLTVLSVAPLLAQAIDRIETNRSISELFV